MAAISPITCAAAGEWTQITRFADEVPQASFGPGGQLYLLTRHNAPLGRIVRVPVDRPAFAEAKPVVTESKVAIESFCPTARRLYVVDQAGGPEQVRVFPLEGGMAEILPLAPVSAVGRPGADNRRRGAAAQRNVSDTSRMVTLRSGIEQS